MLYGVNEVMKTLDVAQDKAYKIIRQLNDEIEAKGYLTVRGKVPESYLKQRFMIEK